MTENEDQDQIIFFTDFYSLFCILLEKKTPISKTSERNPQRNVIKV